MAAPTPSQPTAPPSSCAQSASRITAGLLAFVLILGLPLALLASNWARVFFDPERMAEAVGQGLIDSGILREMAMETLFPRDPVEGGSRFGVFQGLDAIGRERALELLIPRGWAQDQVGRLLNDLYAWFDNDQPRPALTLDIGPVRERLLSGGARELTTLLVDSWPDCTPDQLEQLRLRGFGADELPEGLMCHPPEPQRTGLIDQATRLLINELKPMPSVLPLGNPSPPGGIEDVGRLKQGIRLIRALARWGWLLPLSTLGLIAAVVARSWPQLLRWWGVPLVAAGGTGMATLVVAGPLGLRLTQRALAQSQLPPFLEQAMLGVGDRLRDAILGALLFESILLLVIGGVVLGAGAFLGRRRPATN